MVRSQPTCYTLLVMNEGTENTRRVRQLSSDYVWHSDWLPLGFGDLLSLFYWYTHSRLESHRAYYQAFLGALGGGLGITNTPFGVALRILPDDPKGALIVLTDVAGEAGDDHEDALARRYASHALLRRREEVITFMRLNTRHMSGGPGDGLNDAVLGEAIARVYIDEFEARSLEMGHILLSLDEVLHRLLLGDRPLHAVSLGILIADYGSPNPRDVRDDFRR
jgi:hypothetical protein